MGRKGPICVYCQEHCSNLPLRTFFQRAKEERNACKNQSAKCSYRIRNANHGPTKKFHFDRIPGQIFSHVRKVIHDSTIRCSKRWETIHKPIKEKLLNEIIHTTDYCTDTGSHEEALSRRPWRTPQRTLFSGNRRA